MYIYIYIYIYMCVCVCVCVCVCACVCVCVCTIAYMCLYTFKCVCTLTRLCMYMNIPVYFYIVQLIDMNLKLNWVTQVISWAKRDNPIRHTFKRNRGCNSSKWVCVNLFRGRHLVRSNCWFVQMVFDRCCEKLPRSTLEPFQAWLKLMIVEY